jgi:hypothetical protein
MVCRIQSYPSLPLGKNPQGLRKFHLILPNLTGRKIPIQVFGRPLILSIENPAIHHLEMKMRKPYAILWRRTNWSDYRSRMDQLTDLRQGRAEMSIQKDVRDGWRFDDHMISPPPDHRTIWVGNYDLSVHSGPHQSAGGNIYVNARMQYGASRRQIAASPKLGSIFEISTVTPACSTFIVYPIDEELADVGSEKGIWIQGALPLVRKPEPSFGCQINFNPRCWG